MEQSNPDVYKQISKAFYPLAKELNNLLIDGGMEQYQENIILDFSPKSREPVEIIINKIKFLI